VDAAPKGHLPRLSPEHYRGRTIVHWTLTIERRAKGWLTPDFHLRWQLALLHACTRYDLLCPAYVLMPDHVHLLWIGLNERGSDQRIAAEFLRKNLRPHLAPADWQQQAHDHVLREAEREHDTFRTIASYIFDNPVRAGLISGSITLSISWSLCTGLSRPRRATRRLLGVVLANP
jgi:REP element-mobilizing transposase RayT